ncbi:MAG: extensin family protein [Rhodospirillales bacterium]|nr:extensin family protein [Rhodospirillales bacterium]
MFYSFCRQWLPGSAGRLAAVLALALLAACAPRIVAPVAVAPRPAPPPLSAPQGLACYEALGAQGAAFEPAALPATAGGCHVAEAVILTRLRAALDKPATMACPLAVALADFEAQIIQPAAHRHFGHRVTMIRHYGAYGCRTINGTRKLSQHAFGRAIDISGFDLADGTRIDVKRDWRNAGARTRFLHEVARAACDSFGVVLTPNRDRSHDGHLHLDIGPDQLCGY